MTAKSFYLQWHITARCPLHCKHCYIYDSRTYPSELRNELSLSGCFQILQSFNELLQRIGVHGHIAFSGGDVFLHESIFWALVEKARSYGISFSVLGNPDLLTLEKAVRLRDLGIRRYQISLDGLEKTHDWIRQTGSFRKSIWALCMLENLGIRTSVMFTLSRTNVGDLIPVMRLVGRIGVSNFGFDRVSAVGLGEQHTKDESFSPQEYRDLCNSYLEERRLSRRGGILTRYSMKSHLLKLLLYERGELDVDVTGEQDHGCPVGRNGIAILADGSVLPCRRMPIVIGRVPEQSVVDVFTKSSVLNRFRQRSNYEKCKDCELYHFCRGCPAVAYGTTGSPFAPDPQCWK